MVLLRYDTTVADIVLFAAYVLIGIAFPGVFTWRLLLQRLHANPKRPVTWFEDLSLGSIFGFGLQLPVYIVGVSIGFPYLVVLLPLVAAVLSALPFGRRIWRLPTARIDPRASWALAATTVYGVGWLGYHAFQHRPLTSRRTAHLASMSHSMRRSSGSCRIAFRRRSRSCWAPPSTTTGSFTRKPPLRNG